MGASCSKSNGGGAFDKVVTYTPYYMTENSALLGGEMVYNLNLVSDFGICWSDSGNPTIKDDIYSAKDDYNNYEGYTWFTHTVDGLSPNTNYRVRCYVKLENGGDCYYGETKTFNTSTASDKAYYRTFNVNGVEFRMVRVESGTFYMGAQNTDPNIHNYDPDAETIEAPAHEVELTKTYYIGETEVTQGLWKAVMGSNHSYHQGDDLPVEKVSYNEIVHDFMPKLRAATGMRFRLPTEAEWEFAARGENQGRHYKYAGSDNINKVGWHADNSGEMTHPVGQKMPNERGLYDMVGNVSEPVDDWFYFYKSGYQADPHGSYSTDNPYRIYRGGSYCSSHLYCRTTCRGLDDKQDNHYIDVGFRLAMDP